jgi:hypothetical protein
MKTFLIRQIQNGWLFCDSGHDTFYPTLEEVCARMKAIEQSSAAHAKFGFREKPQRFRDGSVQIDLEEYLGGNNHPEV